MPAVTTSYVKNIIRRSFSELADPGPTRDEQVAIWAHFDDSCAYCDRQIRRGAKEGHIDHLVSASQGGSNAPGNRVLSCASCNEKEKLDRPWEQFLRAKADSDDVFISRRQRIVAWQRAHSAVTGPEAEERVKLARSKAEEVVTLFEQAVGELRRQLRGTKQ